MPIDNPTALVEEFKKSGEFDRVRRELLAQFQQDESYPALKERVEDIARQRLAKDQMMQYMPQETVYKELAQEVDRYPIVERAVADGRILSDPTFLANVESSLQKILRDDRGGKSSSATKDNGSEKIRTSVTQASTDPIEKDVPDAQQSGNAHEQQNSTVPSDSKDFGNPLSAPPDTSTTNVSSASSVAADGVNPTDSADSKTSAMDQSSPSQTLSHAPDLNTNPVVDGTDDGQQPMDIDVDN
ncbi:hypothetical protein NLJ89_g2110 [Agrocybe chaxingu]|uniref:BOD1/SHG1 domain-containing protein n=1 Tax=Agrocybe chaxingu TaxID=84603 RepID=A0A9W8K7H9_9AGAR|nr:hypothetical protein NLJ89_g2110 [Agrocybe chaxingu]